MHYLCKHCYNWSDEADFEGLEIIDEKEHSYRSKILNLLEKYKVNPLVSLCFGTNEDETYKLSEVVNPGEPISDEEAEIVDKLLSNEFGYVPYIEYDLDSIVEDAYDEYQPEGDKIETEGLEGIELRFAQFINELTELRAKN